MEGIRPLTQEERQEAVLAAKEAVKASFGPEPQLQAFVSRSYRSPLSMAVWALSIVVLLSAFILSSMRMYDIGYRTFTETIDHPQSATAAGLAIIILSEITQVISGVASGQTKSRLLKVALWAIGLGATVLAIVGNFEVVSPFERDHVVFAFIEAVFPPIVVLVIAHVVKFQLLKGAMERAEAEANFLKQHEAWERNVSADPTTHERWMQFLANALRDKLRQVNARTKAGREILPTLSTADWKRLVARELEADSWYIAGSVSDSPALPGTSPEPLPKPLPKSSNMIHHSRGAVSQRGSGDETRLLVKKSLESYRVSENGSHTAECHMCGKQFSKGTFDELKIAMTSHTSRFCRQRLEQ